MEEAGVTLENGTVVVDQNGVRMTLYEGHRADWRRRPAHRRHRGKRQRPRPDAGDRAGRNQRPERARLRRLQRPTRARAWSTTSSLTPRATRRWRRRWPRPNPCVSPSGLRHQHERKRSLPLTLRCNDRKRRTPRRRDVPLFFFSHAPCNRRARACAPLFQYARRALVGLHAPPEGIGHLLVAQKELHFGVWAKGTQGAGVAAGHGEQQRSLPHLRPETAGHWPEMSTPNSSMASSAW